MRKVALVLVWIAVVAGGAQAANPSLTAGGGGMSVLSGDRDAVWSEPPNFDGLLASSEVIGVYGLQTEIANDFYVAGSVTIGIARWWGGYYNNYGCSDIGYATNWNLRFYDDGGCIPNSVVYEAVGVASNETYVYCQSGIYPIFKYQYDGVSLPVQANTLYWFGAQAADHTFPPQVGRVASAGVVSCDTVFKSAYFSYPDWTPAIDVFGVAFDASQEFEQGGIPPPDRPGACCVGDQGECQVVYGGECYYLGGEWMGEGTDCDPNPCTVDPVKDTSWGQIKNIFR